MTKIEWTEATWNPVTGCTKISPGCLHCYIERTPPMRMAGRRFDKKGCIPLELYPERLDIPLRRRKPTMYFVNSMSDLFHEDVPFEFIDRVFAVMALAPQHTFQVLTKRAVRMRAYFAHLGLAAEREEMSETSYLIAFARPDEDESWEKMGSCYPDWPLPNVWLGVSAEDQKRADERIPLLLQTPAAVRFVSCEPLLGPVDLDCIHETSADGLEHRWASCLNGKRFDPWSEGDIDGCLKLDWVIAGGESGPGARPCHPDWAIALRDQCRAANVPYFWKQWGEWCPGLGTRSGFVHLQNGQSVAGHDPFHDFGGGVCAIRVGKKKAGRLLDGAEHGGMPEVRR